MRRPVDVLRTFRGMLADAAAPVADERTDDSFRAPATTSSGSSATEAGFSRVDVLPIEHDFWRF